MLGAAGAGAGVAAAGCLRSGPDCSDTLPDPWRGKRDAAVVVEAYEDFACPHCKRYNLQYVPRLVSEYVEPGRIRYEHHDYPIPVASPASWTAANAARAVQDLADREAFWTYVHRLFEEQSRLGLDLYESLAEEVGAPPTEVRAAAEERSYDDTVRCDKQTGSDRGVQGTPWVFVDGERVPFTTYGGLADAIDQALDLAGVGGG